MTSIGPWPALEGWEETKNSLHAYAKVAGAAPRILAEPHPKWWHVSLKVTQEGLISEGMNHDALGDKELRTRLNFRTHTLDLLLDEQINKSYDLTEGDTATELGRKFEAAFADLGIEIELPEDKYADDEPRTYEPEAVKRYLAALNSVNDVLKSLRSELDGERSPVQLWPHHFDLAFEWVGTKIVRYEEENGAVEYPAQLNFGFAPGDSSYPEAYFYSNPWPFEKTLTNGTLPHGARWFSEGFEGTLLPYKALVNEPEPVSELLEYYRRVFELAKPTLIA
jgi:hypothetical protein